MTESTKWILRGAIPLSALYLASCGDPESAPVEPPRGAGPAAESIEAGPSEVPPPEDATPRQLTSGEQRQVIDGLIQARARQQAEGLGTGSVRVNRAWPYTGYSTLAPDPSATVEARLVAVDVTVSGHTPFFDIDDIEIVDGASHVSYGSDPHAEPLRPDGTVLPPGETAPEAPLASRWLLIYAFPKASPKFRLHYWGKELTTEAEGFRPPGLSLPYPPQE